MMLFAWLFRNRKVYTPGGRRIHHGFVGALLALVGLALMIDDIGDCRTWCSDWRRKWH